MDQRIEMITKVSELTKKEQMKLAFYYKTQRNCWSMMLWTDAGEGMEYHIRWAKKELIKRFSNQTRSVLKLTTFLKRSNTTSREEFQSLVRKTTIIVEKGMMSLTALSQLIMGKFPESIKAFFVSGCKWFANIARIYWKFG